jgi:hypothetical protein
VLHAVQRLLDRFGHLFVKVREVGAFGCLHDRLDGRGLLR